MANKKVRITVIKCTYHKDIAELYANLENPNLKQCPHHREGQIFYTFWKKPKGICQEAWKALQHYVFVLTHNGEAFFNGNFCRYPNMAVITCPDAFKTVTFKLEAVDVDHPEEPDAVHSIPLTRPCGAAEEKCL